jgi:hypothetical protein
MLRLINSSASPGNPDAIRILAEVLRPSNACATVACNLLSTALLLPWAMQAGLHNRCVAYGHAPTHPPPAPSTGPIHKGTSDQILSDTLAL